ncbi:MAG: L-arabinose isomerase [Alkalispirochaetaceae bacterium]
MEHNGRTIWFITGSQGLYGPEALKEVESHAKAVVAGLNGAKKLPLPVEHKGVLIDAGKILATIRAANADPGCVGLIAWMHTFSPAKMWIRGLKELNLPLLHLHTQFNKRIPASTIDMDFMNVNQSAHGGREFGHMATRLRIPRKVVVGHWEEEAVQQDIAKWMRAADGRAELSGMRIARFGDSMRDVAVTDGDRVTAEELFGLTVHGYGIGDLVEVMDTISEGELTSLIEEYLDLYEVVPELKPGGERHDSLKHAARQEAALRRFLDEGGYTAFSDSFQMLHGLEQLPGLAVQRLMAQGYGFGAEGDWKAAALLRTMKVMAAGLEGGTSFMEDYTYDFNGADSKVLGAHMLEICPTISAQKKPSLEIHPLGIGGKADPVRLVFDVAPGPAVNATIVDLGHRFRFVVNAVEVEKSAEPFPKLPVARGLWKPLPDLATAAAAWILAGGSHHPIFSAALEPAHLEDLAEMVGIEFLLIDNDTRVREFKKELRWNEAVY